MGPTRDLEDISQPIARKIRLISDGYINHTTTVAYFRMYLIKTRCVICILRCIFRIESSAETENETVQTASQKLTDQDATNKTVMKLRTKKQQISVLHASHIYYLIFSRKWWIVVSWFFRDFVDKHNSRQSTPRQQSRLPGNVRDDLPELLFHWAERYGIQLLCRLPEV